VVYGPPGTKALVDGLAAALAAQADAQASAFSLAPAGRAIEAHEVGADATVAVGSLSARAGALPGGPLPALGWRIEGEGHSVAVTIGSPDPDALAKLAERADFWVTEAVYGASLERAREARPEGLDALLREAGLHPRLEDVGALAERAGVRSVVLVRLRPPAPFASQYQNVVEDGGFGGRVHVPADGDRLTP
jgi:hypothetical protein